MRSRKKMREHGTGKYFFGNSILYLSSLPRFNDIQFTFINAIN